MNKMGFKILFIIYSLSLFISLPALADGLSNSEQVKIDTWVAQLGDVRWSTREMATKRLAESVVSFEAAKAKYSLEKLIKLEIAEDGEVRWRVRRILKTARFYQAVNQILDGALLAQKREIELNPTALARTSGCEEDEVEGLLSESLRHIERSHPIQSMSDLAAGILKALGWSEIPGQPEWF